MKTREELIKEFDGPFETFYEVGTIKEKGLFKNGILSDDYIKFDEDGFLLEKIKYKNGENEKRYDLKSNFFRPDNLDGYFTTISGKKRLNKEFDGEVKIKQNKIYESFYANGNLKERFNNSTYTSYWNNGNIKVKENYRGIEKNGTCETYYSNGVLESRCFYINGVIEGNYDAYYYTGRTYVQQNYSRGKLHGISKEYYMSGQLKYKGLYDNGEERDYKSYNEDGTIFIKVKFLCTYSDDLEVYTALEKVYEKGVILYRKTYIRENDIIKSLKYFENGQISNIDIDGEGYTSFDEVNKFSYSKFDSWKGEYGSNPLPIATGFIHLNKGKEGKFKNYYKNGSKKEKGEYLNGALVGKYVRYYKNGRKKIETTYSDNKIDGKYIVYFKNRRICMEINYREGLASGSFKTYHNDGNIHELGTYYKGKKASVHVFIRNGNPKTKWFYDVLGNEIENKTIEEEYFYNGNIKERVHFPHLRHSSKIGDNILLETFYENGLLESKLGFPSKKEMEEWKQAEEYEYQKSLAEDEYHQMQSDRFFDNDFDEDYDSYCGACHESPCRCSG